MFLERRQRGFTLIELLVVIAIIAILAAILMPVFAQAREKARTASCQSNLKQIMTAIHMYTQDYDEQPMPGLWYQVGGGNWTTWMEMVNPYIKNEQVFKCPSAPKNPGEYTGGGNRIASDYCWPSWIPYNYWNWFGVIMFAGYPCPQTFANCAAYTQPWAIKTGPLQADKPAESAMIVEGYMKTYYPSTAGTNLVFGSAATTGFCLAGDNKCYRHNEGHNVGFCDGHVKWVQGYKYMKDNSSRTSGTYAGFPQSPYMRIGP